MHIFFLNAKNENLKTNFFDMLFLILFIILYLNKIFNILSCEYKISFIFQFCNTTLINGRKTQKNKSNSIIYTKKKRKKNQTNLTEILSREIKRIERKQA